MNESLNEIYENEYITLLLEIGKKVEKLDKKNQKIIQTWLKKLCKESKTIELKRIRNLYAIDILNCIYNNQFYAPYNKCVPEGNLRKIEKEDLLNRLNKNFCEYLKQLKHIIFFNEDNKENNTNIKEDIIYFLIIIYFIFVYNNF